MSPQPGVLPLAAPSESPPQSLVTTSYSATKATDTAEMTTATKIAVNSENPSISDAVTDCNGKADISTTSSSSTAPSSSSSSALPSPPLPTASRENNSRSCALSDNAVSSSSGSAGEGSNQKSEVNNDSSEKTDVADTTESSSAESEKKDDDEDFVLERPRRILLKSVNPHIICNLCKGYLIDATTIVECLHSFCHSCIMRHLRTEQYCPRCEMMINTAKPNIKPDTTLQAIVYKLVPGLYEKELMRKRAFYRDRPEEAALATPEQRGEDTEHLIFGPSEKLSLSLEYADLEQIPEEDTFGLRTPKYLQCPAIFTVAHLKKFIALKFGIEPLRFIIEIMYKVKTIVLMDHYTLMDVAYIYTWKRDAPMRFFFRVKENEKYARRTHKSLPEVLPLGTRKPEEKGAEKLEISCSDKDSERDVGKETEEGKAASNKMKVESDLTVGDKNVSASVINVKEEDKDDIIEGCKSKEVAKSAKDCSQKAWTNPKQETLKLSSTAPSLQQQNEDSPVRLEPTMVNAGQSTVHVKSSAPLHPPTVAPFQPRLSLSTEDLRKSKTPEPRIATPETSPKSKESASQDKGGVSAGLEPKTEKLKISLVGKNKNAKSESPKSDSSSSSSSGKSSKSGKTPKHGHHHHHHTNQQKPTPPEHDERKVENIKLKIDLSKQNSVTIINVSGPESNRKEVVKSVKPDKEWKLKMKREKEDKAASPKNSPGCDTRHQRFEIKTSPPTEVSKGVVPPITLKAERIAPSAKKCTPSPPPSASSLALKKEEKEKNEEEKKSEFLNSFALTPIKAVASPEKNDKSKSASCSANVSSHSAPPMLTTAVTVSTSSTTTPTPTTTTSVAPPIPSAATFAMPALDSSKQTQAVKRKVKEPSKAAAKKAKTESPKPQNPLDLKKKAPPSHAEVAQSISFKLAPFPIGGASNDLEKKQEDEKLMPAPPPLKMFQVFKKNGVKPAKTPRAPKVSKAKPAGVARAAPPGSLTPHPMAPPPGATSKIPITASAPGSRTPIARRYPPILPKPPRPNPFANIPTDVNKLLQGSGTEIKQISAGGRDVKVYGPSGVASPGGQKSPMAQPAMQPQSSIAGAVRPGMKNPNANNYLNYALFNASKARMPDVPLGCRTPIYTSSSPIYSPNSPQYMPNYNIPTQPTYKYTKTASNAATNYLQNVLGLLSNLFPAPPIKKPPESPPTPSNNNKSPPPENENKKATPPVSIASEKSAPKRAHSFSRSPTAPGEKTQEPPEKQMKVQTLLNSCNINIPSSLSITITNDDGDANANNSSNPKHKSPVNNYIEILKLPDNQPISPEKSADQKKPCPPPPQQQKFEEAKGALQTSNAAPVHAAPPALYTLNNNAKQASAAAANAANAANPAKTASQPLITVKSFANLSGGKASSTTTTATTTTSSKMKLKKC